MGRGLGVLLRLGPSPGVEMSHSKTHRGNAPAMAGLCLWLWGQVLGTLPRRCQASAWLGRSTAGGDISVVSQGWRTLSQPSAWGGRRSPPYHTFLIHRMLLVRSCC